MCSVSDNDVRWYVLGSTSPKRELKIRDDARRYGLESFVPLKYVVKTVRGQERRLLVPAVTKLVFVKGTLAQVQDYLSHAHLVVFIQRSTFSGHKDYLTVATEAMENFIAVAEQTERHVTYFRPDEIVLREGDKIRVKGGLYDGREGVIMRIKGKRNKHLVVQIPGILIAAVEMTPEMIEMKDGRGKKEDGRSLKSDAGKKGVVKSKNLDKDRKSVFDLAHRLLFEFPDKYQNENEYYLLRSELERARQSIMSFKGFTAAAEAELALPLFMASMFLDEDEEAFKQKRTVPECLRLVKAIEALKDSSMLKRRCQLYLAVLTQDEALLSELETLFTVWRNSTLSPAQRALLDEYALCVKK